MKIQSKSLTLTVASLAVATVFAYTIPNTFAQFTSQTKSRNNSLTAGTLGVKLLDADGNESLNPVINITNAQPAMASQSSTIRIANTGSLNTDIRLYSTNLSASANNLNEVLNIAIKDSQNNTLYSGTIASLSVNISSLAASTTKVLTATITWPDLVAVDDNPYQGATLSFEFAVDSVSVSI
ncbi:MAG: hypothetical protein NT032_00320 [Actinobacteria bacterium]|nr:hypothetical protein [Actinomycetota bacterium]